MDLIFKKLQLKVLEKEGRTYSFAELQDFIDFDVKRLYFIQGHEMQPTGQHCHKIEKELFVMVKGTATAIIDQGQGKEEIPLREPGDAIYVGNYVWHGYKDFSPDSVLLAISSTNYSPDRTDYIEDYDEYRKVIGGN